MDKKTQNTGIFGKIFITVGIIVGVSLFLMALAIASIWVIPKVKTLLNISSTTNILEAESKVKVITEENVIIDVVEKTKNAVVSIATEVKGSTQANNKIGTGFIVDKAGLIVTNQHVVSVPELKYKVITNDGKAFDVKEILIDDSNDIALLKVDAQDLTSLELGDASKLKVGQLVIAIGTPLGEYAGSVTTGVISGLNRSVTTGSGSFWSPTSKQYEDVIQTDAAINPGNSGGPLLDSSARVIGVNFATTSSADNISFALPINKVSQRLEEYRKYGKFVRPYLGVEYNTISEYQALYYDNVVPGALIVRVVAGSPAAKGGIKKDDIVTKFGDDKVVNVLSQYIQKHKVGEEVTVEVWRDGKTISLKVKLEEAS